MKKSIFAKIGAAAVVLTLVTSSLVGGTFAKYASEVSGNATASVAKWDVSFDDAEKSLSQSKDIVLKNENTSAATADGKIAPGSQGKIEIIIDGSNAEVGYSYSVSGDVTGINGIPLTFYTDSEMKSAITITGNKFSIAQKDIEYSDIEGSMEDKATIYWKWDGSATDEKDKELGEAATVGTIGLTMTAEQLIK